MPAEKLLHKAEEARKKAYVPYSNFSVGASVQMKSGQIYTGCNIENAAYSHTCCAERVAIFKALSTGEDQFVALAVTAATDRPISPCGACRQVMNEFFDAHTKIYLSHLKGEIKVLSMKELLPYSFDQEDFI